MIKIFSIALFLLLPACGMKTQYDITLTKPNLAIPSMESKIPDVSLYEVNWIHEKCFLLSDTDKKIFCLDEENFRKDVDNINRMRRAYNALLLKYKSDRRYFVSVIEEAIDTKDERRPKSK